MKILGKCPFCDKGDIEVRDIKVNGKKSKLYACTKAKWKKDEDIFVLTEDSTCSYKIFSNSLLRYNKAVIGENEIKKLLKDGQVEVTLHSRNGYFEKDDNGKTKKKQVEYKKFIVPNLEYGLEIIWD